MTRTALGVESLNAAAFGQATSGHDFCHRMRRNARIYFSVVPIVSYLVYPAAGCKESLTDAARGMAGCEVLPAENHELLVVVAESGSRREAEELEQRLLGLKGCGGLAMVAAFDTEEGGYEQA